MAHNMLRDEINVSISTAVASRAALSVRVGSMDNATLPLSPERERLLNIQGGQSTFLWLLLRSGFGLRRPKC